MSRIDCCTEPRENGGKRQRTEKRKKAVLRSNGSPCPARLLSSRQPPVCRFLSLLAGPGRWNAKKGFSKWRMKKKPNGMLLAPLFARFRLLIGKGGPAARKRKVGSCKSEREVARPLFEEIGPLSGLKAAQQLENRTRPQADPRKKGGQTPFWRIAAVELPKKGPNS